MQMEGIIPFMSEIVHHKAVICFLNTRNNFSSSLGVSVAATITGKCNYHPRMRSEDAQLIASTLEL